jgi:hypothetical protein
VLQRDCKPAAGGSPTATLPNAEAGFGGLYYITTGFGMRR